MHIDDGEEEGLGQWIALATAALSAAGQASGSGLFAGKAHYSPWGFLYDEYGQKMWDAEKAIREATGQVPVKAPRPLTTGPSGMIAALEIVPAYVPGSEQMISNYDRRLNEPGGAYEVTYGKQLARMDALVKGQTVPPPAMTTAFIPQQSASAAIPISAQPPLPALQQVQAPGTRAPLPVTQASMFGGLSSIPLPVILGGAAVLALLLFTSQSSAPQRR